MEFARFLESLFADGQLRVEPFARLTAEEITKADAVLAEFERQWALELPGEPPGLLLDAARWAAVKVYRACQLAVYRDLPAEAVAAELDLSASPPKNPSVHYSVDLTFRYLPELLRFAASAAEGDPLVGRMREIAAAWPLSSVGVKEIEVAAVDINSFAESRTLMRMYADRIIATGDKSRLRHPRTSRAVREAIGDYDQLAPSLASALATKEEGE